MRVWWQAPAKRSNNPAAAKPHIGALCIVVEAPDATPPLPAKLEEFAVHPEAVVRTLLESVMSSLILC